MFYNRLWVHLLMYLITIITPIFQLYEVKHKTFVSQRNINAIIYNHMPSLVLNNLNLPNIWTHKQNTFQNLWQLQTLKPVKSSYLAFIKRLDRSPVCQSMFLPARTK